MTADGRVHFAIQPIYNTGMDEALWPDALKELTDVTGRQSAILWVLDVSQQPPSPRLTILTSNQNFMKEHLGGMVPLDPTVQHLVHHPNEPIVRDRL